jgi:hypothetical protein
MRTEWAAVFAPVIAAVPIALASFATNPEWLHPLMVISALVVGLPVAVAYSVASSYFLSKKLLRPDGVTYAYCALWGTLLATITALIIAGGDPLAYALIAWGAIAGLLFRAMSDVVSA